MEMIPLNVFQWGHALTSMCVSCGKRNNVRVSGCFSRPSAPWQARRAPHPTQTHLRASRRWRTTANPQHASSITWTGGALDSSPHQLTEARRERGQSVKPFLQKKRCLGWAQTRSLPVKNGFVPPRFLLFHTNTETQILLNQKMKVRRLRTCHQTPGCLSESSVQISGNEMFISYGCWPEIPHNLSAAKFQLLLIYSEAQLYIVKIEFIYLSLPTSASFLKQTINQIHAESLACAVHAGNSRESVVTLLTSGSTQIICWWKTYLDCMNNNILCLTLSYDIHFI